MRRGEGTLGNGCSSQFAKVSVKLDIFEPTAPLWFRLALTTDRATTQEALKEFCFVLIFLKVFPQTVQGPRGKKVVSKLTETPFSDINPESYSFLKSNIRNWMEESLCGDSRLFSTDSDDQ